MCTYIDTHILSLIIHPILLQYYYLHTYLLVVEMTPPQLRPTTNQPTVKAANAAFQPHRTHHHMHYLSNGGVVFAPAAQSPFNMFAPPQSPRKPPSGIR